MDDVSSIRYAYPYYIILIQGQYALNLDNIQNFLSHSGLKTFLFVSKILKVFCQHSGTSNNITKNQMHANIYGNIYSTLVTYICSKEHTVFDYKIYLLINTTNILMEMPFNFIYIFCFSFANFSMHQTLRVCHGNCDTEVNVNVQ